MIKVGVALGATVIGFALLWAIVGAVLGYWLEPVDSREVAVQFRGNQPHAVVGPGGVWTDLSPFADLKRVKIANVGFCAKDNEVVAQDQQSIAVEIRGDVRRPSVDQSPYILENWSRLAAYWTDDTTLVGNGDCASGLMPSLARQAAKVCVGQKPAMESVIGEARDAFRACVDENIDVLAKPYGLTVENVVVPNVELGEAVRTAMQNITNARYAVQIAEQESAKAKADADRDLAIRQGQIRVTEGQAQEEARQRAALAALTQQQLQAERAVIEQRKSNDKFTAEQDLEITRVKAQTAAESAKVDTATNAAMAALYTQNPAYAHVENTKAVAAAYKAGDKFIVEPGTDPVFVIGGADPVVTAR